MGEVAASMRASRPQPPRQSYRWIVNAILISIAFAVLLFFGFFLVTIIYNSMHSSETGWTDYTPEQLSNMKFWYWISLAGGVALIFLFFLLRRDKYDS
jgi:TRAP-type C4-dicarboxylate transport system permease small subunit